LPSNSIHIHQFPSALMNSGHQHLLRT
jgi:hypothetical protein